MSLGSSFELEKQLIIANELGFIENENFEGLILKGLILKLGSIQKMLVNFQKHLNK